MIVRWIPPPRVRWLAGPSRLGQEELLTPSADGYARQAEESRDLTVIEKVVVAGFFLSLVSFMYNVYNRRHDTGR